jgi:hypothetical protein
MACSLGDLARRYLSKLSSFFFIASISFPTYSSWEVAASKLAVSFSTLFRRVAIFREDSIMLPKSEDVSSTLFSSNATRFPNFVNPSFTSRWKVSN